MHEDAPALELSARDMGSWRVGLVDAGRGVPVVLLHGSGDGAFVWRPVLERLVPDRRVCAVDFGSTVRLAACRETGRFEDDRDALRSLLAELGEPVHLVGHSYGALLGIRHAVEEPGGIRSLALIEPIAFGLLRDESGKHRSESGIASALESFFEIWSGGDRARAIGVIVDYWNGDGVWRLMGVERQERLLAGAERIREEVACAYEDRTTAVEVRELAMPTLIAYGANTTCAARDVCELLTGTIPGARGSRVEGAGHSSMRSHPGPVARALEELMASAERAAH